MLYVFRAKDGTETEKYFDSEKAPKIGKWVTIKGKRYQRVISLQRPVVKESRHVAYGLPRKWQNTWVNQIHDRFDERGRAIFETKAEIQNFEGKAAGIGKKVKFDPDSGVDQSAEEYSG